MRKPIMAFIVVLMMVGPTALALAADQPSADRLDEVATQSYVKVVDITSYPDDQDGDRLFDGIQVVANVHFNRTGNYTVSFKLSPTDGSWWLSSAESQRIDQVPFDAHFEMLFEGWKIRNRAYDGYLVAQVDVLSPVSNAVLSSRKETLDGYYRATDFESTSSGAEVTGFGTMRGLDFDGNGKSELLEVPVNVRTTSPGLYRVVMYYSWQAASISDVNARAQTYSITNLSQMDAGDNTVPMWVSGAHLSLASTIQFSVYVYKGIFPGRPYLEEPRTVVNRTSFEAPLLRGIYAGEHVETAVDRDSDGMAEALRVSTKLDVHIPGKYTLTAFLGPAGTLDVDTSAGILSYFERLLNASKAAKSTVTWTFEPGERWAFFEFDGRLLNAWDHDGAYDVYVVAYGPPPTIATVFNFDTAEFLADQFVHPRPPLEFTKDHTDKGVLDKTTGLFSGLSVEFNVKVNTAAVFTASAVLYHDGKEVAYARAEGWLPVSVATIILTFPGPQIHASGASGSFDAVVWVQGAGIAWNDTTLEYPMTASHRTGEYSYVMFDPPKLQPDRKDPQPMEDLDYVLLRTGIMVVRVERDEPDLLFYMTDDEGRTALFRVTYTRLLAFADVNGDGAPQASEVAYTSALWAADWDLSEVSLAESPETGRVATFSMAATVDLVENDPLAAELARPLYTIEDFARITLVFTLSSRDLNRTEEVGSYQILGGAELKVDIHIDVLSPVKGIDLLTIEQVLKDDRGAFLPRTTEAGGTAAPDQLRRYAETPDLKQRIEFRKSLSAPAFYSWVKRAEVTRVDGTEEVADVLAAYMVTDGRMFLYLSYPYDVETASIYHDPSLGIYESGFPGIPEEWKAVFDPLLYGMAALAAAAVVTALRSRGGREDEPWEDDMDDYGMGDEVTDHETEGGASDDTSPVDPPGPRADAAGPPGDWVDWED